MWVVAVWFGALVTASRWPRTETWMLSDRLIDMSVILMLIAALPAVATFGFFDIRASRRKK